MKLQTMQLSKLLPAKYNPRSITPEALEGLRKSIERFGLVQPIIYNKRTKRVVGGHQRLKVLAADGVTETDVVIVDLPDKEEKALNVALNNPAIQGQFTAAVKEILDELRCDLPDLFAELRLEALNVDFPDAGLPEFKEYDESAEQEVEYAECPSCGHRWPL